MGRQQDIARNDAVKEYGIKFRPYLPTEEWPDSLQNLGTSVHKLVKQTYDEWREDVHLDNNRPWRTEIRSRADFLSQLALQTKEDGRGGGASESYWRWKLEPEVFKRFELEVNCHVCTGRLWRAFVEVNPSSDALRDRQQNRRVCSCDRSENPSSVMLNQIFGSVTEYYATYDATVLKMLNKKHERPDRVCGLRRTGRIETNMFRKDTRADSGGRTVQMQLRSSLRDGDSICLFPFLVFESKGSSGKPRSSIENQTAFVIRESLLIQKNLQNASQSANQDSEPCLWCISQRGEDWDVYLAYLVRKQRDDRGDYGVNVVLLWSGDVCDRNNALRLLLIMDTIFDWARDDYREKVIRQLQALVSEANTPARAFSVAPSLPHTVISINESKEIESDHYVESFSEHSTYVRSKVSQVNVHFNSLVQATENLSVSRKEEIQSWNLNVPDDHTGRRDIQLRVNFDSLRNYDSEQCAFRDATFIRSRVMGLFITEDNVDLLFQSKLEDHQSEYLLGRIITKLKKEDLLVLRGDTITAIEQAWAGYNKDQPEIKDPYEKFYVLLTFSAYIGSDWEQVRELSYLAVSTRALKSLCKLAKRNLQFYWVRCDLELIMSLVEIFLRASISANLTACLYRVSMTPYLIDEPHDDNVFRDNINLRPCLMLRTQKGRPRDLVWDIYRNHRIGRIEPSAPYLRVSSRLDKQTPLSSASAATQTGAPWTTYTITDSLVLSYNKNPTKMKGPEWSLFLVKGDESRKLVLGLMQDDAQLHRAYKTYRLGPEAGWERVRWNMTAEFDDQCGISKKAKRFAKHLAHALFNNAFNNSTESSDVEQGSEDDQSMISGQSSYFDDGSILSQTSSGYESDDTVQEGFSSVLLEE